MERNVYFLEKNDNSRFVNIIRIAFGILCIVIAVFWIIFNIKSLQTDGALWITIVFLTLFGVYQILAGFGKTSKYIEISDDRLILKQNSVLPGITLQATDIHKIEIMPLTVAFICLNESRSILRFGVSYPEIIIPAKESITEFANRNNISVEIRDGEI